MSSNKKTPFSQLGQFGKIGILIVWLFSTIVDKKKAWFNFYGFYGIQCNCFVQNIIDYICGCQILQRLKITKLAKWGTNCLI
jgi:hypothetical protein